MFTGLSITHEMGNHIRGEFEEKRWEEGTEACWKVARIRGQTEEKEPQVSQLTHQATNTHLMQCNRTQRPFISETAAWQGLRALAGRGRVQLEAAPCPQAPLSLIPAHQIHPPARESAVMQPLPVSLPQLRIGQDQGESGSGGVAGNCPARML